MKLSALNWICSRPCGGLLLLLKQSRINEGVPPHGVQFDRNSGHHPHRQGSTFSLKVLEGRPLPLNGQSQTGSPELTPRSQRTRLQVGKTACGCGHAVAKEVLTCHASIQEANMPKKKNKKKAAGTTGGEEGTAEAGEEDPGLVDVSGESAATGAEEAAGPGDSAPEPVAAEPAEEEHAAEQPAAAAASDPSPPKPVPSQAQAQRSRSPSPVPAAVTKPVPVLSTPVSMPAAKKPPVRRVNGRDALRCILEH